MNHYLEKNFSTRVIRKLAGIAAAFVVLGIMSGCASTGSVDNDPLEKLNRGVTEFNLVSDRMILAPVARGYKRSVPSPVRNGVHNFLTNLREPWTIFNDLLQANFRNAGRDTGRFLINTILGFAGFNDVARYMDLPRRREDFGQTLAVWGVPPGPHLVLPFFGPSNFRDTVGLLPDTTYRSVVTPHNSPEDVATTVVSVVDTRTQFLGTEELLELQPDQYLFLREGYRQRRALAISNGKGADTEGSDEELLDQLLEDN